jgi:hypothetical protein
MTPPDPFLSPTRGRDMMKNTLLNYKKYMMYPIYHFREY